MLASIVKANPAIRGCSRLEPKGRQSSPGCLTWPGAHSSNCRCSRADLNPLVSKAEHGNAVSPGHAVRGRPNRKAGKRSQHGEGRRSQSRCVMRRIGPRRPSLAWQESRWNRLEPGKANDDPETLRGWCVPKRSPNGAQRKRPRVSIVKLLKWSTVDRKMHRFLSSSGRPRRGASFVRHEPCEGKLSRTVLRGAWAG